jgi:HAD superfamily hydrolase (TIGR01509 family)
MTLFSAPQAVLFDMDGLLLDTERIAMEVFARVAQQHQVAWSPELGLQLIGNGRLACTAILNEYYACEQTAEKLMLGFIADYPRAMTHQPPPQKPHAYALLQALQLAKIPCAVATSTPHELAKHKLELAGLLTFLPLVVGGDQVAHGKPAPDIYLKAANLLGFAPAHCVALEDSNTGARAALAANMRTIVVPDLLQPAADVAARATVLPSLKHAHQLLHDWKLFKDAP